MLNQGIIAETCSAWAICGNINRKFDSYKKVHSTYLSVNKQIFEIYFENLRVSIKDWRIRHTHSKSAWKKIRMYFVRSYPRFVV